MTETTAAAIPAFVGPRRLKVRAVSYGVRDAHGTTFAPGCFTESLSGRTIPVLFNHDRGRIIGRVTGYDDTADGLDLYLELADPADVPDARMAASLLRDKFVEGVSVGFSKGSGDREPRGFKVATYRQAWLSEVSIVPAGSVPNARVLELRSADLPTDPDIVEAVLAFGRLDQKLARADLRGQPVSGPAAAMQPASAETARLVARQIARSKPPRQMFPDHAWLGRELTSVEVWGGEIDEVRAAFNMPPPVPPMPSDLLSARPHDQSEADARAAWAQSWHEQHG